MNAKTRAAIAATPAARKQAKEEKQKQMQASGIARNARGQWIKGFSGNDLGRPRTALAELCREQVTKHGLVNVLGSIAARTGDYCTKTKNIQITVADQIQAIKLLLLYGFGMPKNDIDSGDVKIEVTYADKVTYDNRQVNVNNMHKDISREVSSVTDDDSGNAVS